MNRGGRVHHRSSRPPTAAAVAAVALTPLLAGCGGSTPAPVAPSSLIGDLMTQAASSQHGYATVLVTRGRGPRRFTRSSWPRHIAVQMSCRGASTVSFAVGHDVRVKVACAAGQAGGGTMTIARASALSVIAPARARWSLVVAGRTGTPTP